MPRRTVRQLYDLISALSGRDKRQDFDRMTAVMLIRSGHVHVLPMDERWHRKGGTLYHMVFDERVGCRNRYFHVQIKSKACRCTGFWSPVPGTVADVSLDVRKKPNKSGLQVWPGCQVFASMALGHAKA